MKKNITKLMIILSIISSIIILCNTVNGESLVDSDTVNEWTDYYLAEYMKIIEEHFGHEYGYYFNAYSKHPFNITTVISENNGIAININPDPDITKNLFQSKLTTEKIEDAVFEYNELNCPFVIITDYSQAFVLNWGGEPGGTMLVLNNSHDVTLSKIIIITNEGHFLSFENKSDLLLNKMIIDNVLYNHTYLNGCNEKICWTNETAKETAYQHIKNGLENSFETAYQQEEFKNFFAYPDLKTKLTDIKNKLEKARNNDLYIYTIFDWENDLKDVDNTAFNKYGISNDFLQKIIKFVDETYMPPSNNQSLTKQNEWNGWQFGVGLFVLQIFIIIIYPVLYEKTKKWEFIPLYILIIGGGYCWLYYGYLDQIITILKEYTNVKLVLGIFPFIPIITLPAYYNKMKEKLQKNRKNNKKKSKTKKK